MVESVAPFVRYTYLQAAHNRDCSKSRSPSKLEQRNQAIESEINDYRQQNAKENAPTADMEQERGWSGKKQLCNFAMQDSFNYVLPMPTKFDVWLGEKHLTFFYGSGNTEPLTAQKVRICQILGISPQLARFSVSQETIDAARLSSDPTFESEGTKFWLP